METFLGAVVKSGKMYDTFAVETLADALTVSMKSKGLLPGVDAITARQMSDILQRSVGTAVNRTTLQTLRVLDAANHGADAITKALAVAALSPSGIYPTWQLIKNGAPAVGRWVNKVLTHASEIHNNQLGKRSIVSYFNGLDVDAKAKETIRLALVDDETLLHLYREPQYIT